MTEPTKPEPGTPEEPTPPRFRERRSAFVEDDGDTGAAVRSAAESPTVEPPPVEPPPVEPSPVEPSPVEPPPHRPAANDDEILAGALLDADAGAADDPGALDLDRLDAVDIPEASFHEIVEPLRLQALQFLGEVPLTEAGERAILPRWAKHVIDLLGILEQRTRGNLALEEREYMDAVLDDLRTRYLRAVE